MDLDRQPCAMQVLSRLELEHGAWRRSRRSGGMLERHLHLVFLRQHFTKPSDDSRHEEDGADDADGQMGDQTGEKQRHAASHHERGPVRSGNVDRSRACLAWTRRRHRPTT
jgi:hypothetical protein